MGRYDFSRMPTARPLSDNQRETGASDFANAGHDLFTMDEIEARIGNLSDLSDLVGDFQSGDKAPGGKSMALIRDAVQLALRTAKDYIPRARQEIEAAVQTKADDLDVDDEGEGE